MKRDHVFFLFILFLTFISFYFLYRILSPFLEPILWAILLAMVLSPLSRKLRRILKERELLSALIMTFFVVLLIILPFSFLLVSLVDEVGSVYHRIEEMIRTGVLQSYWESLRSLPAIHWMMEKMEGRVDVSQADPFSLLLRNFERIGNFLFDQSAKILRGLSSFVIGFFFTILSLYYLFKDGERFFKKLEEILPLPSSERDLLVLRFREMVNATIYGGLLIALVQGTLGGFAFWVLGIHAPVLWGTAMALFSFIPIGGTALIWMPASVILLLQREVIKGLILLAIGALGIGMVDNFLRPYFISARTRIHPLLLFFAVLGGLQAFGLIGLILGPLVATVCLTLVEIYIAGAKALAPPPDEGDAT